MRRNGCVVEFCRKMSNVLQNVTSPRDVPSLRNVASNTMLGQQWERATELQQSVKSAVTIGQKLPYRASLKHCLQNRVQSAPFIEKVEET